MVSLWDGKVADEQKAFQLLHIMDIIRFWAESVYKPIVCTCLRRVEAIRLENAPSSLEDTLWDSQAKIDEDNPAWLFHRIHVEVQTPIDPDTTLRDPTPSRVPPNRRPSAQRSSGETLSVPSVQKPPESLRKGRASLEHRSCSSDDSNTTLRHDIPSRASPTHSSRAQRSSSNTLRAHSEQNVPETPRKNRASSRYRSMVPEIQQYSWILDQSSNTGNHIMIRIDSQGKVMPPIICFDISKEDWEDPTFGRILESEEDRLPPNFTRKLLKNPGSDRYMWSCKRRIISCIGAKTQFSAILPLDYKQFGTRAQAREEKQLLEPIEDLLNIGGLLRGFADVSDQWCDCKARWNDYSTNMLQCANARCETEWFHHRCVELEEEADPPNWLCPHCVKIPKSFRNDIEEDLELPEWDDHRVQASYERIKASKAICVVWHEHIWPEPKRILEVFRRVTHNLDIVQGARYPIHQRGIQANVKAPRYWVCIRYIRNKSSWRDLVRIRSLAMIEALTTMTTTMALTVRTTMSLTLPTRTDGLLDAI